MKLSRRSVLRHAAAASLWPFIPACRPTATEHPTQEPAKAATEGALRFDLLHQRSSGRDRFSLSRLRVEPKWAGRTPPAKPLDWGNYRFSVYDPAEKLLYTQGFDSPLDPEARSAATRLSVRCPLPAGAIRGVIEKRRAEGAFQELLEMRFDPADPAVARGPVDIATRVDSILLHGEPDSKVDIAILGDGYQEAEHGKFVSDAKRAVEHLFSVDPFRKRMADFNVSSVFAASVDSGVTDPYLGLNKNTVLRCAYSSGEAERTLAANDVYSMCEVASAVPHDFILVLANARRYGGSAYFGGPAVVAIDSDAAPYLILHEFAHVIGGLAEEYYIPDKSGPSFTGNLEPWHPNVTTGAEKAKWRDALQQSSEPTPWNKAEYERYFADYVRRYFRLRAARADEAAVEKFMREESRRQAALLARNANQRKVGLYEGAHGYAKGVYRAEVNCIMFSLQTDYFCAACSSAIERMIDSHCA